MARAGQPALVLLVISQRYNRKFRGWLAALLCHAGCTTAAHSGGVPPPVQPRERVAYQNRPLQHLVRVEHAERLLPVNPPRQHGLERLIAEAQAEAAGFVRPGALAWLPDVREQFRIVTA